MNNLKCNYVDRDTLHALLKYMRSLMDYSYFDSKSPLAGLYYHVLFYYYYYQ